MIAAWSALEFAKAGHETTLITTRGGPWAQASPHKNLQVLETIAPSWDGEAELKHHLEYRSLIHQEYIKPDTIVVDHTWLSFNYMIQQSFPQMNLIHVHHGMLGYNVPPPVRWPRFCGVSMAHAMMISQQLHIPAHYVYNGTVMPPREEVNKGGDYLLSLNRITEEKGIHDSLDIAMETRTPIKIVGDDTNVLDHRYVRRIIERCEDSGGLAEYYGLVDHETKIEMLKNCRAVIACPVPRWLEAFGLYAVEGMSYGKPVLATKNGGLMEIIQHNKTGYLAGTPNELKDYVSKLDGIDPKACRERAEYFSVEKMGGRYLKMFEAVIKEGQKW